jgi:DNA/RNA endonuclease YhcR with UshA esterase domain
MKKFYLAVLLLVSNIAVSQILYEESFETAANGTNYNTSILEFSDGFTDFFTRTDGSNIATSYEVTNIDGSFYFAGMDIDAEGATLPVTLSTTSIGVSGLSSVDFSILLAEDDDAANQDWDDDDYLHITYSIDGGAPQNLLWVENDGTTFNGVPLIDTDFDGTGDGAEITSVFTSYTENIAVSGGSNIQFFLETNLDSGDEDIAFDNIVVSTSSTGPTISATPTSLTGFIQFVGNPSAEQTFDVSGTNLTTDITLNVTAGDYEISETSGAGFGTTITLAQTAGSVATTTIYVRLNGAAAASPSNGTVTLTAAGATDVNVILEGEILNPAPTIFVNPNALSGFSHFVGTPSTEQTFDVSGELLTNDIIVTAPAEYEVSLTSGAGFGASVTLTPTTGSVAVTTVYVRLNGAAANNNQTGDILITSTGATDEAVALEGETIDYALYPIGSVTTNDADGVVDSLNVLVELRGVTHCLDFDGDAGYSFTIIDGEGNGINVFNFNDVDAYVFTEGDSIGVKGSIDQFNGLTQIFAEEINLFSQGNATESPSIVTALDETTESQLVTLEGLALVNGEATWPSGGNIDVTNGTNNFTVRVTGSSPLAGAATPSGFFNITGLGGQYDSSVPHDAGYQLFPCSVTELCNVDISTTLTGETISANATGLSYEWVDCDDNFTAIAGETGSSFTAAENGNYAVIITDGACVDTSDCVVITTVGLVANNLAEMINLYPNPISNEMYVNAKDAVILSIEVMDATGKSVYTESLNASNTMISTNSWESGVYFVNISTINSSATLKVVK